jgi:hypothetical protein
VVVDRWDQPEDLLAEEASLLAAAERSQRRWARQATVEGATFHGLVRALAETKTHVTMTLSGGHVVQGVVLATGWDLLVVGRGDHQIGARTSAIATVSTENASPADDREPVGQRFAELLRDLAETPGVALLLDDGSTVAGAIAWVGSDLVSVKSGITCVAIALSHIVALRAPEVIR